MADTPLFDWSQQKWSALPDASVTQAVSDGTHSFQDDMDIPVISPKGDLGSVKGKDAQEAFRGGFRFATYDDAKAWEQRGKEASLANLTDTGEGQPGAIAGSSSPQDVGFAQGLSSLVPGFNSLIRTVAGVPAVQRLVGGGGNLTDEDIANTAAQYKERNPFHDIAGNIVGAVAGPVGMLAGAAGKIAGEGATSILGIDALQASGILGATGTRAADIASKIVGRGVGSTVEAAIFNGADQINESALGDPSTVAQNILVSSASSMIFGGKLGVAAGMLEATAPEIKKLATGAVGIVNRALQRASEKVVEDGVLRPLLTATGKSSLMDDVGNVLTQQEARAFELSGGGDAARKVATDWTAAQQQLQQESTQLAKEVNAEIKTSARGIAPEINEQIATARGDLGNAMDTQHAENTSARKNFFQLLDGAPHQPGTIYNDVAALTDTFEKSLLRTGDTSAATVATDISKLKKAREVAVGIDPSIGAAERPTIMGASREMAMAVDLRDRVTGVIDKMPQSVQPKMQQYVDDLSKLIYEQPQYGAQLAAIDHGDNKLAALSDAVGKVLGRDNSLPKNAVIADMVTDPAYRAKVDALLTDLPNIQSKLSGFLSASDDLAMQQDMAARINGRLKEIAAGAQPFTLDELQKTAQELGTAKIGDKLDRIRDISQYLQSNEPPVTKLIRVMKETGQQVPADYLNVAKYSSAVESMAKIRGSDVDGNLLSRIIQHKGQAVAGAVVGSMIGGDESNHYINAAIGGAVGMAVNPARIIDTLTRLENMSNRGAKLMDKAIDVAVDGMTSQATTDIGIAYHVHNATQSEYRKQADYVSQLAANPQQIVSEYDKKVGTVPGAPQISTALQAQYARGIQFLATKVQQDPLANYSLAHSMSPWEPSDFQLASWNRYVNAVQNPISILDAIAKQTVTPEQVETARAVYPDMYARLQRQTMDAIIDRGNTIPYTSRVNIGTVLGIPGDATIRPEFIQAMQQKFAKESGGATQQQNAANPATPAKVHATSPSSVAGQPSEVERVTYQ